jgi:chromate reductase
LLETALRRALVPFAAMTSRRVLTVCGSLQPRSANRAAIDVARGLLETHDDVEVEDFTELAAVPPLDPDPDHEAGPVVERWRDRIAASDAVLFAAPEYGGGLAGTVKNALDWIVGSGELYAKPVAVISAGTTGGSFARQHLVQTLTWQGAHVVADLGIASPRTKSDADGRYTDPATVAGIEALAGVLLDAVTLPAEDRLALVRAIVDAAGVDPAHIAPVV